MQNICEDFSDIEAVLHEDYGYYYDGLMFPTGGSLLPDRLAQQVGSSYWLCRVIPDKNKTRFHPQAEVLLLYGPYATVWRFHEDFVRYLNTTTEIVDVLVVLAQQRCFLLSPGESVMLRQGDIFVGSNYSAPFSYPYYTIYTDYNGLTSNPPAFPYVYNPVYIWEVADLQYAWINPSLGDTVTATYFPYETAPQPNLPYERDPFAVIPTCGHSGHKYRLTGSWGQIDVEYVYPLLTTYPWVAPSDTTVEALGFRFFFSPELKQLREILVLIYKYPELQTINTGYLLTLERWGYRYAPEQSQYPIYETQVISAEPTQNPPPNWFSFQYPYYYYDSKWFVADAETVYHALVQNLPYGSSREAFVHFGTPVNVIVHENIYAYDNSLSTNPGQRLKGVTTVKGVVVDRNNRVKVGRRRSWWEINAPWAPITGAAMRLLNRLKFVRPPSEAREELQQLEALGEPYSLFGILKVYWNRETGNGAVVLDLGHGRKLAALFQTPFTLNSTPKVKTAEVSVWRHATVPWIVGVSFRDKSTGTLLGVCETNLLSGSARMLTRPQWMQLLAQAPQTHVWTNFIYPTDRKEFASPPPPPYPIITNPPQVTPVPIYYSTYQVEALIHARRLWLIKDGLRLLRTAPTQESEELLARALEKAVKQFRTYDINGWTEDDAIGELINWKMTALTALSMIPFWNTTTEQYHTLLVHYAVALEDPKNYVLRARYVEDIQILPLLEESA